MKRDIKLLALEQRSLKNQRKTVHIQGDRMVPVWKAVAQHAENRYKLRHLYPAYALMRGKTPAPPKVEPPHYHSVISSILQTYEPIGKQAVCADQV